MSTLNLKFWTSYVSPTTMELLPKNNILPIFVIRKISNSNLIGGYSGTSVHVKELSPSYELLRDYKYEGKIGIEEFEKGYIIELSQLNIEKIMGRICSMAQSCSATGVAFMGYGKFEEDYRSILSRFLSSYGHYGEIKEIIL